MKTFLTLATVVVVGLWGFKGWRGNSLGSAETAAGAAPAADSSAPGPQISPGYLRATGETTPKSRVRISATVSLPIVDLPVREGSRVSRGSVLARLDDGDLQAALRAAEAQQAVAASEINVAQVRLVAQQAQVTASRVSREEAERDWKRIERMGTATTTRTETDAALSKLERLNAEHQAALEEYEASRACLATLQQKLRAAEADVERARIALSCATLTSPIDGIVTCINVEVGEVVTGTISNPGTVLMEVADLDRMLLTAQVPEQSIAALRIGQNATVLLSAYGAERFPGVVEQVGLTKNYNGASACFEAEVRLDTGGRVIPAGLSGEAIFETAEREMHGARVTSGTAGLP